MSINDPIVAVYRERRQTWILVQGRETFYDENRRMREWSNEEEALAWRDENLQIKAGEPMKQEIG